MGISGQTNQEQTAPPHANAAREEVRIQIRGEVAQVGDDSAESACRIDFLARETIVSRHEHVEITHR